MIEFKPYESKSVTRMAFQLTDQHEWHKIIDSTWIVSEKIPELDEGEEPDENTGHSIHFKAYAEPVIGDWIVKLTDEDTYHCTDTVFQERNIVPE